MDRESWNSASHYSYIEAVDIEIKCISKGEIKTQGCIAGLCLVLFLSISPSLGNICVECLCLDFKSCRERLVKEI